MRLKLLIFAAAAVLLRASGDIDVPITNHWNGGFQADVCFSITTELHSWKITLTFDQPITSLNAWSTEVAKVSDTVYELSSLAWNKDEHAGDNLCVTIQCQVPGNAVPKLTASLDGLPDGGTHQVVTTKAPATAAPGQSVVTPSPKPVSIPAGSGVHSSMTVNTDWGERFEAKFVFQPTEDILGYVVNITFSKPLTKIDSSTTDPYYTSPDGKNWVLVNKQDRPSFLAGQPLEVRFFGNYQGGSPAPTAEAVLVNMGVDHYTVPAAPDTDKSKYNYNDVLYKSFLFYEAQRSGKLPANKRIPWRGDSALGDKGDGGEDLTGGWYDAGDHVKFNFPMAASTTMLAWGYIEYPDAYEAAGQTDNFLDGIKWPLDYLLKCHTGPEELYVQVGNADADHNYWGPPELMTMARPAYKISPSKPGSDVAMETAAAMAAGYLVFKNKNPTYASTLLQHAKQLWEFAIKYEGKYSDSVPAAAGFYKSTNLTDEICWGSLWLHRATNDSKYLDEAEKQFDPDPAWGQSWDEKTIGNQLLLYRATGKQNYKTSILNSYKGWFPGGTLSYTPKGLPYRLEWGSLRYASNMAFAALVAADSGFPVEYRHWAMCVIHYALGDTGFSFLIGFGDKYPRKPHHRSSSCPNSPAPCGPFIMSGKEPNVHTLYGALVGGPGRNDDYTDDRSNYVNNEVACDYNAGFTSAVAALKHLLLTKEHPELTGSDQCPYS